MDQEHVLQVVHRPVYPFPVTVAHYPSGASKWNPSSVASSLRFHATGLVNRSTLTKKILNYARTTTTQTGPQVTAYLDRPHHPCGIKPSTDQIASLRLRRHETLPDWNYTIKPQL
ncbi:MAG TPA: hypothetical protein VN924_17500 [Bryobacteraceae bacterium]|nr:hypothetical protein [Bryobacteraceae bacterium]